MKRINVLIILIVGAFANCLSQESTIYFGFNQYTITPDQSVKLQQFCNKNKSNSITLYGYTDTVGSIRYNNVLSEQRIASVKSEIKKCCKNCTFEIKPYGEKRSFGANDSLNRKVEIIVAAKANTFSKISATYKPAQIFTIDNSKDTTITGKEGTSIYIPAQAIVVKNKPVTKPVQLYLSEYYTLDEMILAKLTTTSNDKLLQTGGMIKLDALQGKDTCTIAEGKSLGLHFKNITEKDSMQIFNSNMNDEYVNWEQNNNEPIQDIIETVDRYTFTIVEQPATFNGGDINSSFRTWVYKQIKYPVIAAEQGIEGKVIVSFDVNTTGEVCNVWVLRSSDTIGILNAEAVRVVKSSPKWTPPKQGGVLVIQRMTLPILFTLNRAEESAGKIKDFKMYNVSVSKAGYQMFDSLQVDESISPEKKTERMQIINSYYLFTNKFEWINCDRFTNKEPLVNITVSNNTQMADVFIIVNDIKSISWCPFPVPKDIDITVIGMTLKNNKPYFAKYQTKASSAPITLDYKEVTTEQLKQELKLLQ